MVRPMLRIVLSVIIASSTAAFAGVDSIGEPNVTWLKRKIHVCWHTGGNDFAAEQKAAVQKIVEQEYTTSRTGISFVGWEDCQSLTSEQYDLMIIQDNILLPSNETVEKYRSFNSEGSAVLGQGAAEQLKTETNQATRVVRKSKGFFNRDVMKPVMYLLYRPSFRMYDPYFHALEELQMVALHEFGHVAGLRHEHIRSEAKNDPNCKNMQEPKPGTPVEELMSTAATYTDYDPNSVMNYCWGATLAKFGNVVNELPNIPDESLYTTVKDRVTGIKTYTIKIGLSAKDLITLNKLYPKVD